MIRYPSGCLKPLFLHDRFVILIQILAGDVVLRNLKRNRFETLGSLEVLDTENSAISAAVLSKP